MGVSQDSISEKGWVIESLNFLLYKLLLPVHAPLLVVSSHLCHLYCKKKNTHEMGIPCATPYTSIFHNSPPICLGFAPFHPSPITKLY